MAVKMNLLIFAMEMCGGIRHLYRDRAQPRGPCRELHRPCARAGGERLHQEHPAGKDEDQAGDREPQPEPAPPVRAAVLHHGGTSGPVGLLHARQQQAH